MAKFRDLALIAWVGLCLSLPPGGGKAAAQLSTIFVRNRQVLTDDSGGVSVIHFFRLLEEGERARLKLTGSRLKVTDLEGQAHEFSLTEARKLLEWEQALALLGYEKRVNSETGVTDFRLATAGSAEKPRESIEEAVEQKLARSLRRPAYRSAQARYEKVIEQFGLAEDEVARSRVRRLGNRIASVSPLAGLIWNFDIIKTPVPNALCTGEGHVLITTGLLDLKLTDDELAGVLGHEVAHGVRRHAELFEERYREFFQIRNLYLELTYEARKGPEDQDVAKFRRLKSEFESKQKRLQFLMDYLKNQRDYNQDEEEEADVLGMQYAVAAGFDSNGESQALKKLKARSVELFGQSYDDGTRSHPPLERRLQILQMVRDRWKR